MKEVDFFVIERGGMQILGDRSVKSFEIYMRKHKT